MSYVPRVLATLALASGFLLLAAWCAVTLDPTARRGRFLGLWALWTLWLQAMVFEVLLSLGLFRFEVATPLVAGVACALEWRWPRARTAVTRSWHSLRARWRGTPTLARVAVLLPTGWAFLALARSLLLPTLSWDGFTYHLWRAARWVQCARDCLEDGPSAWHYYNHYPYASDAPWAWALMGLRGDMLIGAISVSSWVLVLLGVYQLARAFEASRASSFVAALSVAVVPACLFRANEAYVDNFSLAAWCLGMAALVDAYERRTPGALCTAWLGLSVSASFKPTGVACLVVAMPMLLIAAARAQRRERWYACIIGIVGLASYVRTGLATGNPVYPFDVVLGSRRWLEGHREMNALFSIAPEMYALILEADPVRAPPLATRDAVLALFAGSVVQPNMFRDLHLGLGSALTLVTGLAAIPRLVRRRTVSTTTLVATAVLVVASYLSPAMAMQRWQWLSSSARLLLHVPTVSAVLVAAAFARYAPAMLATATVMGFASWRSRGVPMLDLEATAWGVLVLGVVGGCIVLAKRWPSALVGVVVVLTLVTGARPSWRRRAFHALALRQVSDNALPLAQNSSPMPWLWNVLAEQPPRRLAFVPSWNPAQQQRWFLYPLVGAQLQHDVHYVAPTADGTPVDFYDYVRVSGRYHFDHRAWLRRLCALRIDGVVAMGPNGQHFHQPDMGWISNDPTRFVVELATSGMRATLYRFRPLPSDCDARESSVVHTSRP